MSMFFMEPISVGYENTKYLINRFELQEIGDFAWRPSDCEELLGVTQRTKAKTSYRQSLHLG